MKNRIFAWFFRDQLEAIAELQRDAELDKARHERLADEAERYAKSINITDLVRAQLKGFNPQLLDVEDDLIDMLGDEDSTESFLAEAKKLQDNSALPRILTYIERNQVQYSAKEAPTLDAINFGRATLNGVSLVREEVKRLSTAYDERHAAKEEFDPHEAL